MSDLSIADYAPPAEGEVLLPEPEVVGLRTRHFLVDSSVYIKFHVQLHGPVWTDLKSAMAEFGMRLHTNELIRHEVGRWLTEEAEKLSKQYENLVRNAEGWNRRRFGDVVVPEQPDIALIVSSGRTQFSRELAAMGSIDHDLEWSDVTVLMKRYMSREPPFHKPGSKEFPDAVIIDAARTWTERNGEQIYVISEDDAMLAHAGTVHGLLPVRGLAAFLELVAEARDPAIGVVLDELYDLDEFHEALLVALEQALPKASFRYLGGNYQDAFVESSELHSLDLMHKWTITAVEGDVVSLLISVTFGVRIDAVFVTITMDEEGAPAEAYSEPVSYDESVAARLYVRYDRRGQEVTKLDFLGELIFDDPDEREY